MAAVELDATVGGEDANSYASVDQADALAETRVGPAAAAWRALDNDTEADLNAKKRALITATRDIDTVPSDEFSFIDERASDDQALEFPRNTSPDTLPSRLVDATIELAFLYNAAPANVDVLSPVVNDKKRIKADDVDIEYFTPQQIAAVALERFPAVVQRLLSGLIVFLSPVGDWGSGTSVRTS